MPDSLAQPAAVSIEAEPPLGQPSPKPLLFWAGAWWQGNPIAYTDLPHFPDRQERLNRRNSNRFIASVEFRLALKRARRLWILDQYFDRDCGAEPLAESLQDATVRDLRINGMDSVEPDYVREMEEFFTKILSDTARGAYQPVAAWRNALPTTPQFPPA
jgi:hypothetical protein